MSRVLVIDDDVFLSDLLVNLLQANGMDVDTSTSIAHGLTLAQTTKYDLIILDIQLPDGDGISILDTLLATPGEPHVVVITGSNDPENAERALSQGAWDYLPKPFTSNEVIRLSTQALTHRRKNQELFNNDFQCKDLGIIGESPKLRACLSTLFRVAETNANCLITGETGTGKELLAHALHGCSGRSREHFVVVDCTNIPESLAEAVLFGHAKGAFTDAREHREGLFKQAHGGTLFLDEIGDLDLSIQKSLLRVLQEKKFRPIGARAEVSSDFRLVAATNRDLSTMADAGLFRPDLLFRLSAATLHLPPLRERGHDVILLAKHFTKQLCEDLGIAPKAFSEEFEQALLAYPWPGNVRELSNAISSTIVNAQDDPLMEVFHLPIPLRIHLKKMVVQEQNAESSPISATVSYEPVESVHELPTFKGGRQQVVDAYEKQYFTRLLQCINSDLETACKVSGVSRARLYQLLKKHNLSLRDQQGETCQSFSMNS